VKVCDKTCIFFFFPIINKYILMAKRSLLSRCPSYNILEGTEFEVVFVWFITVFVVRRDAPCS